MNIQQAIAAIERSNAVMEAAIKRVDELQAENLALRKASQPWDGVIRPEDFKVDTFAVQRSGFILRPDSAVRVTHVPTGHFAECTEARSQHANRAKAWEELTAKLEAIQVKQAPGPFDDIQDKRMGELTDEQKDRAIELWLRNQVGWLPLSQREQVEALLRVIDGLRAAAVKETP